MKAHLSKSGLWPILLLSLGVTVVCAPMAQAKPLTEQDVIKLIELQIDEGTIVAKLQKDGAGFAVDAEALKRLKAAGASDAVLAAVEKAGKAAPADAAAAAPAGAAVSYQDIVKLLELNVGEEAILKRLEKSPTKFVLDAKQIEQIKKLGGSAKLIAALQAGAGAGTAADAAGNDITDFVILLDCSGSMDEQTADGQIKMDVAKKAVSELVQGVPNGLKVMFVIYGHDKALACKAVQVVRPLSRIDDAGKSQLAKTIAALKPVGGTPIALALKTAGEELAKAQGTGTAGIVLISDGKESCKGDPAAEAATLAKNLKLKDGVTVIGFGVEGEERNALESIASAGKGKYLDAKDAAGLVEAVKVVEPVAESSGAKRRAVRVMSPTMDLPKMKMLALVPDNGYRPGASGYSPIAEVKVYEREMRLPSTEKFDIWWVPEEGIPVRLKRGLAIPERTRVDLKPEDHIAVIRVKGEGLPEPKMVAVVEVGGYRPAASGFSPIQTSAKYGEAMVVPAGTYDIWMEPADGSIPELLESKLEVPAGKQTVLD